MSNKHRELYQRPRSCVRLQPYTWKDSVHKTRRRLFSCQGGSSVVIELLYVWNTKLHEKKKCNHTSVFFKLTAMHYLFNSPIHVTMCDPQFLLLQFFVCSKNKMFPLLFSEAVLRTEPQRWITEREKKKHSTRLKQTDIFRGLFFQHLHAVLKTQWKQTTAEGWRQRVWELDAIAAKWWWWIWNIKRSKMLHTSCKREGLRSVGF